MKFTRDVYASGAGDKKDCSVRSFATAACVPYEEAYKIFERHGRKSSKGTSYAITLAVLKEQFPNNIEINERLTLPQFAAKYNKGHFIVHIRNHALAIIDGVIHDWRFRPRTKVWSAWKIC